MKRLKHIFNLLFNINYQSPDYKNRRIDYLKRFKKSYDVMDIGEKILSMSLYKVDFLGEDVRRHLGALEATHIMIGNLEPGGVLPYLENELYSSCLVRITKEYLNKTGCYEEEKGN